MIGNPRPIPAVSEEDGQDLVARATERDPAAMAMLFDRHNQAVHAYLRLQELPDADSAIDEAFASAFGSLMEIDGGGDVAFRMLVLRLATERLLATAPSPGTITIDLNRIEAGGVENDAVSLARRLTPERRDVILLQVAGGLSVQEVGVVLRTPLAAVSSLQRQALRQLGMFRVEPVDAAVPLHLADEAARQGASHAIAVLAFAARRTGPVPPGPKLNTLLGVPETSPAAVASAPTIKLGSRRTKVAAVVGTGIGKVVVGATLAAAAATGGAHASGVIDLPLLPPVIEVQADEPVEPPSISAVTSLAPMADGSTEIEVSVTTAPPAATAPEATPAEPEAVTAPTDDVADGVSGDGPDNGNGNGPESNSAGGNPPETSNAGGNPPESSNAGGNPPETSNAGGNPPESSNAGGNGNGNGNGNGIGNRNGNGNDR